MDDFNRMGQRPLVLFDCDGVLIDSERFYFQHMAEWLQTEGINLTYTRYLEELNGKSLTERVPVLQRIFLENGYSQTEYSTNVIQEKLEDFYNRIDTSHLPIMEGVPSLLSILHESNVPFCVVSNSRAPKLDEKLKAAGLFALLTPRIYSKDLVKNPKPAPDLYLHAARKHNVFTGNCLVIEDSLPGIGAAAKAGMTVIGLCADNDDKDLETRTRRMEEAGADFVVGNIPQSALLVRAFLDSFGIELIPPQYKHAVDRSPKTPEL